MMRFDRRQMIEAVRAGRQDGLTQAGGAVCVLIAVLYAFGCAPPPPQVAAPTFAPNGGTFPVTVSVRIATTTDGATIRYTLDGTDPTTASTEYGGPFELTTTTTVRARAFLQDMADSAVASATFAVTSTTRINMAFDGTQAVGGSSYFPCISRDGRYVAYASGATNLVSGGTGVWSDVFVYDRQTSLTTLVSVHSDGTRSAGDWSGDARLSSDGCLVAFTSEADNLVDSDTNGVADVFVHDRQTGQTTRVSVRSDGSQATGGRSESPSLSSDGRYVAFESHATNLVDGDDNGLKDIFVHDRQTGQTTRVNVSSNGAQAAGGGSFEAFLSGDGRYVAFEGKATNLVDADTNGSFDAFVHDRQTGQTTRISVATGGAQAAGGGSYAPYLSDDGRYGIFASDATNLVTGDTNGVQDVFFHDRQTGQTTRVSVRSGGAQATGGGSYTEDLSPDARYVVFDSTATNLVSGDTNDVQDVFIHDRQTGQTTRVNVSTDDSQATGGHSYGATISSNGRYVVFQSWAEDVVADDTNERSDIFLRDRGQ